MFIFFPNTKRRDEVYVYIEKYSRSENEVLFDFYDSNELGYFGNVTGLDQFLSRPSMILVKGYKLRPIKEGSLYVIRGEVLRQLSQIGSITVEQGSLLIGYNMNLDDNIQELFFKSKSFNFIEKDLRFEDQSNSDSISDLDFHPRGSTTAVIKNVGQGSWNEIKINDRVDIVFDIGTSYHARMVDIRGKIGDRNTVYQKDKPVCIISHWDVDHYHFLMTLDDQTLASFSKFICRGILPNLTSRIIFSKIKSLNPNAIIALSPEDPGPRRYSTELKLISPVNSKYLFFNGSINRSRNKSGICLAIRVRESSAIFAADLDYQQISDHVLPELDYRNDHYLVVPHHGGKAGDFIYNHGSKLIPQRAIISVGRNPYKHPLEHYINNLRKIPFDVQQTNIVGRDIEIRLS